jgi:ribosomal protein S18 acetylase RimI-like enzyme
MDKVIEIVSLKQTHLEQVVRLMQQISPYQPAVDTLELIWEQLESQKNVISLVVLNRDKVLGYGALLLERKVRGGVMGHIEDIVIDPSFQGQGLGKSLVLALVEIARSKECYKVGLHCGPHNVAFYEECGLVESGSSMQKILG